MTPARLEEVDKALGSEHPPEQRTLMGIAHKLSNEVKRLRKSLEEICRWDDCERGCASLAEQALAGEEPTP